MFGRIFGRGKDDHDPAVCAECGRTLLAGEWTQTIIDEQGSERLICSLCGQAYAGSHEPVASAPAPANKGRVRETRSESFFDERPDDPSAAADPFFDAGPEPAAEAAPVAAAAAATGAAAAASARDDRAESDAFWQALKDKDAQIEGLKAELARAEAERQELAGRFARLGSDERADAEPGSLTGDSSEPGERTWGETPAEFAAEMAALRQAEQEQAFPAPSQPEPAAAAAASPYGALGPQAPADASPYDALEPEDDEVVEELSVSEADGKLEVEDAPVPAAEAAAAVAAAGLAAGAEADADDAGADTADAPAVHPVVFEDTQPIPTIDEDMLAAVAEDDAEDESTGEISAADAAAMAGAGAALPGEPAAENEARAAQSAAEAEAAAASLTLLQRGVDLLNVSKVPRKIAETNEQLGLPHVHAGFDGEVVSVTFMWTMGWYRFTVDLDSGDVSMHDRGYDDLGLQPNAGVRADGTVQLAPAQISRAAAQRAQAAPEAVAPQAAPMAAPVDPETPREAAQKPPEFLSKSLLGQRSDDEPSTWDQTKARDFDWDR